MDSFHFDNMLISDKYRLILMLPQKCASSTLQTRLEPIRDVGKFGTSLFRDEATGRMISKHVQLGMAVRFQEYEERRDYLKACFVRNPYDRVYSWYVWIENRVKDYLDPVKRRELLEKLDEKMTPEAAKHAIGMLENNQECLEKAEYDFNSFLRQQPSRFIPASKFTHIQGQLEMDFIGRVENFEEDFKSLCEMIGFSEYNLENANVISEPHESRSKDLTSGSKYIDRYNADSIELVNHHYADDFELLDYPMVNASEASVAS